MATAPASGSSTPEPFAYFDRESSSWRTCQVSLLEESGESCTTWPRQVTWDRSFVYELRTSALHIFETGSLSSLLPTPQAADAVGGRIASEETVLSGKRKSGHKASVSLREALTHKAPLLPTPSSAESTPTPELVEEIQDNMDDPHERLYLPGRRWHSQRTLSRIVPALLPTPNASDEAGGEGQSRADRQERTKGRTGGFALKDLDHILPTPNAWLGRRPGNAAADPTRIASREHEGMRGKRSLELPEALAQMQGEPLLPTPRTNEATGTFPLDRPASMDNLATRVERHLLPTPTTRDHKDGPPNENVEENALLGRAVWALAPEEAKLLPTPVVTDSFGSRRATARTDEWESNEGTTLTDAIWQTQGRTEDTKGGLLPTPTVAAGRKSERAMTSSASGEGNGRRDGGGMSSPPGLEQIAELTQGVWPRDLPPFSDLPPATQEIVRSLWPGESTSPPSAGGNTSSDETLLGQLTIEDA